MPPKAAGAIHPVSTIRVQKRASRSLLVSAGDTSPHPSGQKILTPLSLRLLCGVGQRRHPLTVSADANSWMRLRCLQARLRAVSPDLHRIPIVPGAWPQPLQPARESGHAAGSGPARVDARTTAPPPPRHRARKRSYVDFTPAQLFKRWREGRKEGEGEGEGERARERAFGHGDFIE